MGIAIKCARLKKIHLCNFYRDAFSYGREMLSNPDPDVRKMYWKFVRSSLGRSICLTFRGVGDNWRERSFYKHTNTLHRLLLQPTHFSFLGLLNIQKYGEPADEKDSEPIYHAFFPVAGQDLIRDGHHWVNAGNFHLANDGPKLLDYGNPETQRIVSEYGIALYTSFDINAGRAQTEKYNRAHEESTQQLRTPSE